LYCIHYKWTAEGEKQDKERHDQCEELSGQSEQYCFELFVVCLRDILKARILSLERRELQQSRHERRKAEARVFVAFVDR